jgi:predicted acyltransferase
MKQAPVFRVREDPLPTREALARTHPAPPKPIRLVSLDAYRGLIMIVLAGSAFGLHRVASSKAFSDSPAWQAVAFQTNHIEWQGGTWLNLLRHDEASEQASRLGNWFGGGAWDLIQPSFMFMVGVAIPFSYTARRARGDSALRVWLHILVRAFLLVALGIFLRSSGRPNAPPNFTFEDVLTQIGLGYPFVVLVFVLAHRLNARVLVYSVALVAILVGYWAYFAYYPLPSADFDYGQVGLTSGPFPWQEGLFAHWSKNTNAAQWFDVWFLNLFPRKQPWQFNGGGYLTLNFVPSMATALFGVIAAEMLRGPWSKAAKFLALIALSAACLVVGAYAGETVCPVVKKIWTPSWAVYSAGWTLLLLALFYLLVDCIGLRWLAFPLVVVGMNSIVIYCMHTLIESWIGRMLQIHLAVPVTTITGWTNHSSPANTQELWGQPWYSFAAPYGAIVEWSTILLVMWLICFWMYRRKVFVRL